MLFIPKFCFIRNQCKFEFLSYIETKILIFSLFHNLEWLANLFKFDSQVSTILNFMLKT